MLIIFGVLYLITAIAYILIRNVKKNCDCLKVIWFVDIAYFIGGILYYVGRNFPGTFFGCSTSERCNLPRIIQPILLGTVVVLYRFIPFFISKYYQFKLAKEHQTTEAKLQLVPEWILAAESLTLLVEFDALYTVIISFIPTRTCCTYCFFSSTSAIVIAAWVLWALFVLMYMLILYYTMNIQYCGNCNVNWSCVTSNLSAMVVLAAFGIYLMSNNIYPLVCSRANLWTSLIVMRFLVTELQLTLQFHSHSTECSWCSRRMSMYIRHEQEPIAPML